MAHWYDKDGKPCHFIEGKNGKIRDTTLRDARKFNYFPSVIEILNCASKPALTNWLVDQALLSALTLPRIEGETLSEFKDRAKRDSKEQTEQAADIGSQIHAAIEDVFLGKEPEKFSSKAHKVRERIIEYTGLSDGWIVEKTFSNPLGYGGMIDIHHPSGWVGDHKSKDFTDSTKKLAYDEHCMQLSAYAHGIGMPDARKFNVFVSRDEKEDLVVIHEWDTCCFDRFECLLKYWQLTKNYKPET